MRLVLCLTALLCLAAESWAGPFRPRHCSGGSCSQTTAPQSAPVASCASSASLGTAFVPAAPPPAVVTAPVFSEGDTFVFVGGSWVFKPKK